MSSQHQISNRDIVVIALLHGLAAFGLFWDGWWHVFKGRDSFFIPPHLIIYISLLILFGFCILWWKRVVTARPYLKWMIIGFLIAFASAPFDEWWHQTFGVENLSSPLIVWSPPHLMGLLGGLLAIWGGYHIIRKYEKTSFPLVSLVQLASLLSILWFIIHPIDYVGLYGTFFSVWGEVLFVVPFITLLLVGRRLVSGGALVVGSMFLAVYGVFWTERVADFIIVPPHSFPPLFVYTFAIIGSAIMAELLWSRVPQLLLGCIMGIVFVAFHIFVAQHFISLSFRITATHILPFILTGILGGAAGAAIAQSRLFSQSLSPRS